MMQSKPVLQTIYITKDPQTDNVPTKHKKKRKIIRKTKNLSVDLDSRMLNTRKQNHKQEQDSNDNLDFGKYKFGRPGWNNEAGLQSVLKTCKNFAQEIEGKNSELKDLWTEMISRLLEGCFIIEKKGKIYLYNSNQQLREIDKKQKILWEAMSLVSRDLNLIKNIESMQKDIVNAVDCLQQMVDTLTKKEETLKTVNPYQHLIGCRNQYLQEIVYKNFVKGLQQLQIDELNFFLQQEYLQNDRPKQNLKIANQKQWIDFISRKKVRLRKATCRYCLSPFVEQSNLMSSCPDCHSRGHNTCLPFTKDQKCGNCLYTRLSPREKQTTSQCFICGVGHLDTLRLPNSKFVHVFCLLSHNIWHIADGKVTLNPHKNHRLGLQPETMCHFCARATNYYTECTRCTLRCHYMCAYLNGCTFVIAQGRQVVMQCCGMSEQARTKLAYCRKYILNYENVVFRKLASLKKRAKMGEVMADPCLTAQQGPLIYSREEEKHSHSELQQSPQL